jgi:hypothetical protein
VSLLWGLWLVPSLVGAVHVELCQVQSGQVNAWPEEVLFEYEQEAFVFDRIPQAYTENGIRDEWPNPLLVRASSRVKLPEGKLELLLRSRRAARLFVSGELVVSNPFPALIRDGLDPVSRPFIPLGPTARFPGKGDQESLVKIQSDGSETLVQLEFFIGGFANKRPMRPETGETLVAFSQSDVQEYHVLGSPEGFPLTDEAWDQYRGERHRRLDRSDHARRRRLANAGKGYWDWRHEYAREFSLKEGALAQGQSIDQLIADRIQMANASLSTDLSDRQFHSTVFPLMSERCFSCHGKKAKGGLRLDSLETAVLGGDSGLPALVPYQSSESLLMQLIASDNEDERMPPSGDSLSLEEIEVLRKWIQRGARWPEFSIEKPIETASLVSDAAFLRRVSLDVTGILPEVELIREFLTDSSASKRRVVIDRLLADPRWADHWVAYWQDVLAENPSIVNPTLNNTGPFRWWIYESFLDNKPMDRFVSELVMMTGSLYGGGPAGFEMASQNDVPAAAKANILTTAFLAVQMKCSRCHDAPFHDNKQEDLFALGAMLARSPLVVPKSSTVPDDENHEDSRKRLIQVSLKPGSEVQRRWPFEQWEAGSAAQKWIEDPKDSRERLAFLITNPTNTRFARVIVNRLWMRYMGRGIVSSADDWEDEGPSHPELLAFLANELIQSGYDLKHVARLILNSDAYQRITTGDDDLNRFYAGATARKMSAEQIVDSLFAATGKAMRTEPLTIDIGGGRAWNNAIHLGEPRRSWMFGGVANNRDRPSLILPRAQAVVDLLTAFGWRPSRQDPISLRATPLSPLQPAMLNNGIVTTWLTRLSGDHGLTTLALQDLELGELVAELYLRLLSRYPTSEELVYSVDLLEPGFSNRIMFGASVITKDRPSRPPLFVTWANHLMPEATTIQVAEATAARKGDAVTQRIESDWRERFEDLIWSIINLPEMIHYP